jgi:hypothetical protein
MHLFNAKVRKRTYLTMAVFVALLQGCSVYSPFFSTKREGHLVIIDYPPNRIAYAGDVEPADQKLIIDILHELEKRKYRPHTYPKRPGVNIDSEINHQFKTLFKYQSKRTRARK